MRKIVTLVCALIATSCLAKPISDSTSYGACIMRDGSFVGINENERFAMHSVMKFPQALYVADYLSRKGLTLDDTIVVDKADLMQDTWSPMLKRFEGEQARMDIKAFSYGELLELSLGQSDNNASELLFKFCGKPNGRSSESHPSLLEDGRVVTDEGAANGRSSESHPSLLEDGRVVTDEGAAKAVEKYMRKLGLRDIHIRMTEEQIHKNPAKAIENSSTPAEMVRLFEWFYHHKDDNQYLTIIWNVMADCSTGLKRISAAIPADARIVHKTGTGFPIPDVPSPTRSLSPEGLQDMNDAGIILMPDGSHVIIAVFTTHSSSEAVIANIARQLLDTIIK